MSLSPERKARVYRACIVFFVLMFAASMWPIYPFFSRIHPMVLGIPFSLVYLILLLLACFVVLLGLFLWEERHGENDDG